MLNSFGSLSSCWYNLENSLHISTKMLKIISNHHLKKLVSCLCPWSNLICFRVGFAFPEALPFEFFIPLVVSRWSRIRLAGGFDASLSVFSTVGMFSLSNMDSFKVLFLLRHFGVLSTLCSLMLSLWDDMMSVLMAAVIMWSSLVVGLGPILILTAGFAQLMSPQTFL